jgi:hypothetical protein
MKIYLCPKLPPHLCVFTQPSKSEENDSYLLFSSGFPTSHFLFLSTNLSPHPYDLISEQCIRYWLLSTNYSTICIYPAHSWVDWDLDSSLIWSCNQLKSWLRLEDLTLQIFITTLKDFVLSLESLDLERCDRIWIKEIWIQISVFLLFQVTFGKYLAPQP